MDYRTFLQKIIYDVINPLIRLFLRIGITPNVVTAAGLVLNVFATVLFIGAAVADWGLVAVGWGGFVILFAGLFDMMDGRLARLGGLTSAFGALWDSSLDRYSELLTLFGIAVFFLLTGWGWSGIVTFLALVGSIMVSYVRARAEGLGIECKVGVMQRPERVVVAGAGALLSGIAASEWPLVVAMALIALLANITAFWRIAHCYKQLKAKEE